VFYLAIIFTTGRGHTPRWDLAGRVLLMCTIASGVLLQTQPGPLHLYPSLDNPFGFGFDLRPLVGDRIAPFIALGVVVFAPVFLVALVLRYRAASHIERLQLRWFAWSIALTMSTLGAVAVAGGNPDALTGASVPVAIGVAILRHHLYGVGRARVTPRAMLAMPAGRRGTLGVLTRTSDRLLRQGPRGRAAFPPEA
jgi:hypothetical protein